MKEENNMRLMDKSYELCKKVIARKPMNFSGIGLVTYDTNEFDENLHCNLRPNIDCPHYSVDNEKLVDYLIDISDYHNTLHDGFHMMNEKGILTHVAQYFVPPVIYGLTPNQDHGVRFHSSLCGSTLKGVLFITIICSDESIYIFEDGEICKLVEEAYV